MKQILEFLTRNITSERQSEVAGSGAMAWVVAALFSFSGCSSSGGSSLYSPGYPTDYSGPGYYGHKWKHLDSDRHHDKERGSHKKHGKEHREHHGDKDGHKITPIYESSRHEWSRLDKGKGDERDSDKRKRHRGEEDSRDDRDRDGRKGDGGRHGKGKR